MKKKYLILFVFISLFFALSCSSYANETVIFINKSYVDPNASGAILTLLYDASSDSDYIASLLANTDLTVVDAGIYMDSDTHSDTIVVGSIEDVDITANRAQDILYKTSYLKIIDFLTDATGDYTYSGNTSISGTHFFEDVDVTSGVTLTISAQATCIIANSFTNDGTVDVSYVGGAGGAAYGDGDGGRGGGGLIIVTNIFDNNSIIQANGEDGEDGTTTDDDNVGAAGGNGSIARIDAQTVGDGGDGGYNNENLNGNFGAGGGGTYQSEHGGDGGIASYTSYDTTTDLIDRQKEAIIDYWLEYVLSKTPSVTQSNINGYGAGGGGGGDRDAFGENDGDCGGGAGAGGYVLTISDTFDNTGGTISANGGNGGDKGHQGDYDTGGGGGGGGVTYNLCQTIIAIGTIQATGGTKGDTDVAATAAKDGTTGIAIAYDISGD